MRNLLKFVLAFLSLTNYSIQVAAQNDIVARGLAVQARTAASQAAPDAFGGAVNPYALLHWKKALGKMRTLGYRPIVASLGDSKTAGIATFPTTNANSAIWSYPYQLAAALTGKGVPASAETWCGDGIAAVYTAAFTAEFAYDPRRSGGTGWSYENPGGPLGGGFGGLWKSTVGTNTNALSFTPQQQVDTVDIYNKIGNFNDAGGNGVVNVTVDASSTVLGTTTTSTATQIKKDTINLSTLGPHKINLVGPGTGSAKFLLGCVAAYNSATPQVMIFNGGVSGVTAGYWTSIPTRLSMMQGLLPDLTIINIGTNDMNHGAITDITAYTASLQAIITKANQTGDCMVVFPAIGRNSALTTGDVAVTDAERVPFYSAMKTLSLVNNCVFVDEQALFGGRDGVVSFNMMSDQLHETGYATTIRSNNIASILTQ